MNKDRSLLYLKMLGIFIAVQVIAVLVGTQYTAALTSTGTPAPPPIYSTTTSVYIYIAEIAIIGVGLALFFKYGMKIGIIQRFVAFLKAHAKLTVLAVFPAIIITFIGILYAVTTFNAIATLAAMIGTALLYYAFIGVASVFNYLNLKFKFSSIPLYAAIFALTGAIVGIAFSFGMALLFFVLLAVYDFVAVFITKHMLVLAKNLMATPHTSIFGIVLTDKSEVGQKGVQWAAKKEGDPRKAIALGSGDLVMPAMVAVSALVTGSLLLSVYVVVGAVMGLLLVFASLELLRRPLPAIPFLAAGILPSVGLFYLSGGQTLFGIIPVVAVSGFIFGTMVG